MEKVRREKMQAREKVGESRNTVVFHPEGRKVGSEAAGAEASGQMRDEKVHAVVARSTFASKTCQSKSFSEHSLEQTDSLTNYLTN